MTLFHSSISMVFPLRLLIFNSLPVPHVNLNRLNPPLHKILLLHDSCISSIFPFLYQAKSNFYRGFDKSVHIISISSEVKVTLKINRKISLYIFSHSVLFFLVRQNPIISNFFAFAKIGLFFSCQHFGYSSFHHSFYTSSPPNLLCSYNLYYAFMLQSSVNSFNHLSPFVPILTILFICFFLYCSYCTRMHFFLRKH